MKTCNHCNVEKPLDDFPFKSKSRGIYHPLCKECHNTKTRAHYKGNTQYYKDKARSWDRQTIDANRQYIIDYLKEHPCKDCGNANIVVLQFDHLRDKLDNVSNMLKRSRKSIILEIAKCDVVCANCHIMRTAHRAGWLKLRAFGEMDIT